MCMKAFTSEYVLIWRSWMLALSHQSAWGYNGFCSACRDLRILLSDKEPLPLIRADRARGRGVEEAKFCQAHLTPQSHRVTQL